MNLTEMNNNILMYETLKEQKDITPEELEYLAVLILCRDLLSRCALSENIVCNRNYLADFAHSLATLTGEVSLHKLFNQVLIRGKREKGITSLSITRETKVAGANIARYKNGRGTITADSIDKVFNHILKK